MNDRIAIYDNWDGSQSVFVDGAVVLERKSHEECREKARFLDAYLAIKGLDTPPPVA